MRRALPPEESARLEALSNAPMEGTFGALRREDFPTLNGPVPECGGGALEKTVVLKMIAKAEDEGNALMAKVLRKMLLPLFIDELETVM